MKTRNLIMAVVAIIFGMSIQVKAQDTDTIGIHVFGGYSSEALRSSNIGQWSRATGYNSFAGGYNSEASGHTSTALGVEAKAIGAYSVALGSYISATENYGIVIGSGQTGSWPLINDTKSIMMGIGSEKPTMVITGADYTLGTGKVGIGLKEPQAKLHISADSNEDASIILESKKLHYNAYIQFKDENYRLMVGSNGVMSLSAGQRVLHLEAARVSLLGKIGVNTVNTVPGYAFAVDGGIITDEVLISEVEDWPDYVFGDSHNLMSLGELQTYVKQNSHLPEVPSAQEVEKNGVNVGEMQKILLKKIEELTLYTIEQQRLIENLQERINQLENQ